MTVSMISSVLGTAAIIASRPAPPMRVLIVNSLFHPHEIGGAERAVRLLAEGLRKGGFDASVACLSPSSEEVRDVVHGVPVFRLPLANIYWPFGSGERSVGAAKRALWHLFDTYNPFMGARLGRLLDELRPDVVHFNNLAGFSVAALVAAKRRRIATVQTLHDYYYVCPRTTTFKDGHNCVQACGACRAYSAPRRQIGRNVDMVCGVSDAMLRRLEAFGAFRGARRRAVVYGANLNTVAAPARRVDHHGGDQLTVGYLGRIDPTKGIETLIDATAQLRGHPVEVAIAGRGPADYEAKLRGMAEGLAVRFVGHVEPLQFLAQIDVLVVPSVWHEPFGRVVQEAFACGVPVVGSASGGIPEVIGTAGPGFLFPPGSSTRLAEILAGFVAEGLPAGDMFDKGLLRSLDFAADRVVRDHIALYRQVLEGAAASQDTGAEHLLPVGS